MIQYNGKLKYLRGKKGYTVYYHFTDRYGCRQRPSLSIIVTKPAKDRTGAWIFPQEAISIARHIDGEVRAKRWDISAKPKSFKINDLLARYLEVKSSKLAKGSIYELEHTVALFVEAFGNANLGAISEKRILEYHAIARSRGDSEYTLAKHMRNLRAVFNFGVRKNMMTENPISRDIAITLPDKDPTPFMDSEIEKLFAYLNEHDIDLRRQLEFLMLTGYRVSEGCAAKWEDVNYEMKYIVYHNIKGKRDELNPMSDRLAELLKDAPGTYDPYIFKYRRREAVRERLLAALEAVKVTRHLTTHDLKSTFTTALFEAGAFTKMAQELSHHRSAATTNKHYVFAAMKGKRELLNRTKFAGKNMTKAETKGSTTESSPKEKAS